MKAGAQTETELKEKKLRVEDALNATMVGSHLSNASSLYSLYFILECLDEAKTGILGCQAAVEEGIVVGGGCTLLRIASKVDAIKETLDNDEEKVKHLLLIAWKLLKG